MRIPYAVLEHGWLWGGATVTRITSDKRTGWVVIGVKSRKGALEIRVTKTGKMSVRASAQVTVDGGVTP